MAIQIGAKPDSGFDDPIGMLIDCHRRIEDFLRILCVVADRAQDRAMTEAETAAVEAALQYFRVGGQRHTQDEEESLFPRLRIESTRERVDELEGLESDHSRANKLHQTIETVYAAWIAEGCLSPEDGRNLLSQTLRLKNLYENHIKVEEQTVFPRAAELLDRQTIAQIGREFQARRR